MARLETREFKDKAFLLVIQETKEEGALLDKLAPMSSPHVRGEVCISDGYGEIYVRLEQAPHPNHQCSDDTCWCQIRSLGPFIGEAP